MAMALGWALLAPPPSAQAQQTEEVLLTNLEGHPSSTGCPIAQGFTTGPGSATILSVKADGTSVTSVEIREDSEGSPSSAETALYELTTSTDIGGDRTFTADADTDLAANTTYWVVFRGGTCVARSTAPSVHPDWTAGISKWWSDTNTVWVDWSLYLALEIVGTIHSGPAHEPEREVPERASPVRHTHSAVPACTEEQAQWRQRGRELPPYNCVGFYHPFEVYPSSDPCDQPWQVPGSYGRGPGGRGCLEVRQPGSAPRQDTVPSSDPCDQPWQVRGSYGRGPGGSCLNRY